MWGALLAGFGGCGFSWACGSSSWAGFPCGFGALAGMVGFLLDLAGELPIERQAFALLIPGLLGGLVLGAGRG